MVLDDLFPELPDDPFPGLSELITTLGIETDGKQIYGEKAYRADCGAKTRAGGVCKAKVVEGKNRCRLHGGLSTGRGRPKHRAE